MEVKDIIRNRRIELDLTMKDVANAVGVSEGTVSRWESGEIANMKRDKIVALASILRISPAVIMGWEEAKDEGYYENIETAQIAQEIHDNTELRALFSAAKDADPQTLKDIHDMLLIMKRREKGDTE